MKPIAYLGIDIQFTRLQNRDLERGLVELNLYNLPFVDLSAYAGIIITNFVEEEFLLNHKKKLEDYLENGGVLFSLVEISMAWLPGCGKWKRSPIPLKDREIQICEPVHSIFDGVEEYDINYRRGVRGFFSRGYFDEIPQHAIPLIQDQQGDVIIYMDRKTTNGTIFAGAGTDLYRVFINEDNTSKNLSTQMLSAIREEAERNEGLRK